MTAEKSPRLTAYERYLKTDVLLNLQRDAEGLVDPDEMTFIIIQQSSELWLKLIAHDMDNALGAARKRAPLTAVRLLSRARTSMADLTRQLDVLDNITPWSYQKIRTQLEDGSGFSSPGWQRVRGLARPLGVEFFDTLDDEAVELRDVYLRHVEFEPLFQFAEALVAFDTECMLWRLRHLKVIERLVGVDAVGTAGTPIHVLAELTGRRLYPRLWAVRSELTEYADDALSSAVLPAAPTGETRARDE
ncbi:tryptophan 2,3-dioxygenase family protein [Streptomyces sp. st115]|uniref:tryptophan 2,3-dioxygenase family protein n=1 Tax=Streptomyces sp. st115 TaxID=1828047 RepID=UPI000BF07575|nr:tryptophan 2,3-dioxygenase family protein [Streptomyces sp. st115]